MLPVPSSKAWPLVALLALLTACAAPRPEVPVEDRPVVDTAAKAREQALAEAEAALARGDAAAAEFYLDAAQPPPGTTPGGRYRRARAALDELRSDPVGQAVSRAALEVTDMKAYDTTRGVELMQAFESVPSSRLQSLAAGSNALSAWADLALSVRRDLVSNADVLTAATAWETSHPGHPVQAPEYLELCWQYRQRFRPPTRIAVLLPTGGPLKAAADAVRDGLMMSWFDHAGPSRIDFLPAGDDSESALAAYRTAVAQGYNWVIGPLRRESTQRISEEPDLPVPTLLLNEPSATSSWATVPNRPLFSLSLSQQAEATAAAKHALDLGHRRALVLAADNSWGQGVEQGFAEAFEAGGGEIVAIARFDAAQNDHSELLTSVLRIEDSRQRRARLQTALGLTLQFEPSRRDDFDVIFLAADPTLGRQLKPQLRFYDAGDKPTLAMSRIYSGQLDASADVDLNGIEFAATRSASTKAAQATRLASSRGGAFVPLQAIGADAWGVLPWMDLMQKDPDLEYPGASGKLKILADGSLHREPWWMRFEQGRPVPVETRLTP